VAGEVRTQLLDVECGDIGAHAASGVRSEFQPII
jgi:hypothetical protein